jgi:hypothetical protein
MHAPVEAVALRNEEIQKAIHLVAVWYMVYRSRGGGADSLSTTCTYTYLHMNGARDRATRSYRRRSYVVASPCSHRSQTDQVGRARGAVLLIINLEQIYFLVSCVPLALK